MHELGIVFHVIKTVERVGAENDLTRVCLLYTSDAADE